jgi:hypothetical protein
MAGSNLAKNPPVLKSSKFKVQGSKSRAGAGMNFS